MFALQFAQARAAQGNRLEILIPTLTWHPALLVLLGLRDADGSICLEAFSVKCSVYIGIISLRDAGPADKILDVQNAVGVD